jgi:hypothetical protein
VIQNINVFNNNIREEQKKLNKNKKQKKIIQTHKSSIHSNLKEEMLGLLNLAKILIEEMELR